MKNIFSYIVLIIMVAVAFLAIAHYNQNEINKMDILDVRLGCGVFESYLKDNSSPHGILLRMQQEEGYKLNERDARSTVSRMDAILRYWIYYDELSEEELNLLLKVAHQKERFLGVVGKDVELNKIDYPEYTRVIVIDTQYECLEKGIIVYIMRGDVGYSNEDFLGEWDPRKLYTPGELNKLLDPQ